jgi:O-antigen/teichoic acid export membrane protein
MADQNPSPVIIPDSPPTRAVAVQSALWAASGAVGRYTLAGLTTLVLTHLLGPKAFGLVAITVAAQALISHVIPVGFHDALIQRPRLDDAALNTAFWSVVALAAGAGLLVIALAPLVAGWFDQAILAPLLAGMVFASLLRAVSTVPRALLNRRMDFRTLTLARTAGMGIGGLVAVGLAASGGGAWSLVAQIAVLNLVDSLIVWRAVKWYPGRHMSPPALRQLWHFAASVSIFTILSYIISNADDQLIGFRLGPESLGFYALAYSFMAWPVRDVLGGVAVVLYPVFSRFQDDLPRLQAAYLESLQLATLFAFPVLALLAIAAPVLVPWLLGARWAPIVLTVQILAIGGLREATVMLNGPIYRALGKPHLHALFELCNVGCYLTAFVVGLNFGIAGVAFFYLLTGVMLQPVSWWLVFSVTGLSLRPWLTAVIPAAVGTGVMSVATAVVLHGARLTWGMADAVALLVMGMAALAVYGLALVVMAPSGVKRGTSAVREFLGHQTVIVRFWGGKA